MTVAENVAYRLNEDGLDEHEIDARVREALGFVDMEDAIDKLPDELSGGMSGACPLPALWSAILPSCFTIRPPLAWIPSPRIPSLP